jgi:hypothetical protein
VPAEAGVLRLAVWGSELSRAGPGLLLRDIRAGTPDVAAAVELIAAVRPDVLLLLDIDHDHRGAALAALQARLAAAGHPLSHAFAPAPNTGLPTGLDLDGDGRLGTLDDAQGWGRFQGAGGMALLSRHPIDLAEARDLSGFLWRELPGNRLPAATPERARAIQRLATTGFWIVPVRPPEGPPLTLLAWHAGPPVFGRVPGRNRARNHDEAAFWQRFLDGELPFPVPEGPLALIGTANADPARGDGDPAALAALLAHPRLQDPAPRGARPGQPADTATADFPAPGPGPLRASYILPDARLAVLDAGLVWPNPPARQALVWVDLAWPP